MRALPSTSKCKSTGLAQRVSSRALRRYFTGGIEPAAAIAQRHNLQRCVLNFLVVAGVLCNRYEDCVGQPFSCGIRSMRIPNKVRGNIGPCLIKCFADDLECLGTVGAAGQNFGSFHDASAPGSANPALRLPPSAKLFNAYVRAVAYISWFLRLALAGVQQHLTCRPLGAVQGAWHVGRQGVCLVVAIEKVSRR
jgi:hypothetical protein